MARTQKTYHHGDLRQALIKAAITLIERDGHVDALSLREVAATAGVSQAAPYAHFSDKRALLAAVAEVGFTQLAVSMKRGVRASSPPAQRFLATGRGYVQFALKSPGMFRLMFSSSLGALADFASLQAKADTAYGLFVEALDAVTTAAKPTDMTALRLSTWSLIHGLASLLVEQRLPVDRRRALELVDSVTELHLRQIAAH